LGNQHKIRKTDFAISVKVAIAVRARTPIVLRNGHEVGKSDISVAIDISSELEEIKSKITARCAIAITVQFKSKTARNVAAVKHQAIASIRKHASDETNLSCIIAVIIGQCEL